jgi:sister chromatid cohesion protein DCC1
LYSYHDLLSVIQASENELLDALQAKGAFEHEGHFRLFDKSYLFRLFDSLVTNAILHGSDFKCMSLKEAKICITEEMNAVEEDESESVPDHVLVACINTFVLDPVDAKNDDALLAFDHRKICRFLGEWLLTNPRVRYIQHTYETLG